MHRPENQLITQHYKAKAPVVPLYAIVISGDGIRTRLADSLCENLAKAGIGAGRARALHYFWAARSPKALAKDLAHSMRRRLKKFPHNRFTLIGYSFGAGTLPFAVNRLPDDLIGKIDSVALLAPPESADFEFFFRSWLNRSTPNALPTAPEIALMSTRIPILYLRGEQDYKGPSSDLKNLPDIEYTVLPGGHDFDKDYQTLFELILKNLSARSSAPLQDAQNTPTIQ